jgi:hypothetical protein
MDLDKLTDEQRDALEKEASSDKFKKFMEEIQKQEDELANHPYMVAKRILDEEFELSISYPKNNVPVGECQHGDQTLPIIESILTDENPGAIITNDLYIIEIAPETQQVILAEEDLSKGMFNPNKTEKDYIIHEYNRKS